MKMLLDTGPLGQLAAVARPAWNWPGSTLHVSAQVAREGSTGYLTQALLERHDGAGRPFIEQHALLVGSDAQRMYVERLRPRSNHATRNKGEDESIALLAHEIDGVFVTMDGKAALSALVELGPGCVMSPFDCWRWLHEQRHIDEAALRELDVRTSKSMGLLGPPPRLG